jgi:hypothetical protein
MRRLTASLAASAAIVLLVAAAPAYASHTHVGSSVRILHGTNEVASYVSQDPLGGGALIECGAALCETPVPLNNRDYGRFVRWCGDASQTVTIPSGVSSAVVVCDGPSTWTLRVGSALNDCSGTNCVPTTHETDVDVQVIALK